MGLVNAAHHNGKLGRVSGAKAPEGRVGAKLDDGTILAIKEGNLEVVPSASTSTSSSASADVPRERTLKRDNGLLREFDGNPGPDTLALYYHFGDRAFDCFSAPEYNQQMLRYYEKNLSVKLVTPRNIGANEYFLVGLQYKQHDKNTLCEVAFNCGRSFQGISMLVKNQCFSCHRPGSPRCPKCNCAAFCSDECRTKSQVGRDHEVLCNLIQGSDVTIDHESVQLL